MPLAVSIILMTKCQHMLWKYLHNGQNKDIGSLKKNNQTQIAIYKYSLFRKW